MNPEDTPEETLVASSLPVEEAAPAEEPAPKPKTRKRKKVAKKAPTKATGAARWSAYRKKS